MLLVGLTGGIGSGKSTVSAALAARGAVVVDADLISREVVEPGGIAYAGLIERFGSGLLRADGTIDRTALADVVFQDVAARKDLEAIVHPAVGQVMLERIASHTGGDNIVVLDIPLLAEKGRMGVSAVIVVDCPTEVAVDRLVRYRGFDPGDARRRVAAQLDREARLAMADFVVDNSGSQAALASRIDVLWKWLEDRRQGERVPSG